MEVPKLRVSTQQGGSSLRSARRSCQGYSRELLICIWLERGCHLRSSSTHSAGAGLSNGWGTLPLPQSSRTLRPRHSFTSPFPVASISPTAVSNDTGTGSHPTRMRSIPDRQTSTGLT